MSEDVCIVSPMNRAATIFFSILIAISTILGMARPPEPLTPQGPATDASITSPVVVVSADAEWTFEVPVVSVEALPADPRTVLVEAGHQALEDLGLGDVEILWDDPRLGGHLGGVYLDDGSFMMVNADRLLRESPERVRSVVLHEAVHVLQAREGGWAADSWAEQVADCGAVLLGADWTWYTQACTSATQEAAEALLRP